MSFINIPFSIIDKRWFSDEMAVRAWVFLAARGILSKSNSTVTIKNKAFELEPGETLCTRSYLSKSLNVNDSSAKGATDKLLRAKSIFKEIEILGAGFRNKISRIKIDGIPVPNDEAFLQVAMTDDICLMWKVKHLAQLYIYLMISANKFDKISIAGGEIREIKRGELVISYTKIRQDLKISEYYLKKTMQYLEGLGLVEKSRCGNDGLFVKMKKYPPVPAPSKKEKIEEIPVGKTAIEVPSKVNVNTEIAAATLPIQHSVENPIQKGLPAADWEGWIKNSATKAIVWYAQRRGWKDVNRVNNMISDVGESGVDLSKLKECLKHLWKTSGNNVVDSRDKAVFVDGAYILKYYNFYLSQKQQTLQQSPATEYSSDSHANQQQSQSAAVMGSESELKYAQDRFNEMTACIQSRGNNGLEYVKNWMSYRQCCVSGFEVETTSLHIDIFEEIKERWNKDKEYLLPFFKYFFGENVNIIFHILKHSVK